LMLKSKVQSVPWSSLWSLAFGPWALSAGGDITHCRTCCQEQQ